MMPLHYMRLGSVEHFPPPRLGLYWDAAVFFGSALASTTGSNEPGRRIFPRTLGPRVQNPAGTKKFSHCALASVV